MYNRNIDGLLSYGYRVTSNSQLIKDSIHDLFLHLWLHRENLSETDSIKFYLYRSLRNRILQNLENKRDISLANAGPVLDSIIDDFIGEGMLIDKETEREQTFRLQKAIEQLPKRQQEVIQLRYQHDFTLEQIADMMHISNQSVRNHLHRAITQLRVFFEMAGGFLIFFLAWVK
jgi:RNA polymerase sigma factor (sigma-70 family)